MTPLRFTVEGAPVGKGRPEAVVIRVQGRHVAKLHTPAKTRHYEAAVALAAKGFIADHHRATGDDPTLTLGGNVALATRIYHPFAPGKKPDADNVYKAVADALSGVLYRDDRQVQVGGFIVSTDPDRPRVEIDIAPMPCETCILCGHPLTLPEVP